LASCCAAYADGETIQFNERTTHDPKWIDIEKVGFNASPCDYRIKPKPREFYISLTCDGRIHDCQHKGEKIDRMGLGAIVKVREIIDEQTP